MSGVLCLATSRSALAAGLLRAARDASRSVGPAASECRTLWTRRSPHPHPQRCYSQASQPSPVLGDLRRAQWRSRTGRPGIRTLFHGRGVVTDFEDLPPGYKDEIGLPFRRTNLSQHEVISVFGPGIKITEANRLLQIMHGRRVAGTLNDPAVYPATSRYSKEAKAAALQYLRHTVPVDEIMNAGLRAAQELDRLEENGGEGDQVAQDTGVSETPKKPDVYGESVLDAIRAKNIAKRKEMERLREEKRRQEEEEEARQNPGGLAKIEAKPRELSPRMQKWASDATSDLTEPPKMSAWARLGPSFIFVVLVTGVSVVGASFYEPPSREARLWPDIPPAAATCLALITLNVAVWLSWNAPPLWRILNRYFIVIPATPKVLQIPFAMFAHQEWNHLALNMVALWFFGTRLHDEVGRANMLALYFASGGLGFLASMTKLTLLNQLSYTTLGASGAIYGLMVAYFWLYKFDNFKILGLPPDPWQGVQGLGFIAVLLSMNLLGLRSSTALSRDVPSHLGGILMGLMGGEYLKRVKDGKGRVQVEKEISLKTRVVKNVTVEKKGSSDS